MFLPLAVRGKVLMKQRKRILLLVAVLLLGATFDRFWPSTAVLLESVPTERSVRARTTVVNTTAAEPGARATVESNVVNGSSAGTKDEHAVCGDWTPRGDLGNPNFDPRYREPLLLLPNDNQNSIGSCTETTVGRDFVPDSLLLYCDPNMTAFRRQPAFVALDFQRSLEEPQFSIISPSYNVQHVLNTTIPTLCQHTTGKWEVIFVLDSCYDQSLHMIRNILLTDVCRGPKSSLLRARVLVQPTSIFETSSDNLGFLLARPSHFYIEVQSDMILGETGWNVDMARPFLQYNDILSLSGRCGHGLGKTKAYRGRCGKNVGNYDEKERAAMRNKVFITSTNNRGPLMFRADALRALGYFDEVNYYLGDDDHDLNQRAYVAYGWRAAYRYVHFYAPLDLSPQRGQQVRLPPAAHAEAKWYRVQRKGQYHDNKCHQATPKGGTTTNDEETRNLEPKEETIEALKDSILPPLPLMSIL